MTHLTGRSAALEAALGYARDHGLRVLPLHTIHEDRCTCRLHAACRRPGKHPRTRHGVRDASCDVQTIERWFAERWADSNIGLATGTASGILALDIDPRHGGDRALDELQQSYGAIPPTVESLTGGGGRHLLFQHPPRQILNSAGALGPGLDVRSDGGLIVVQPSIHISGREYQWHPERGLGCIPLAPVPEALLKVLTAVPRPLRPETSPRESRARFRWAPVLDGVEEGYRHVGIFLMASSLRGLSTPQRVAEDLALHAARHCRPQLPSDEALKIVQDVYRRYPANAERMSGFSQERVDVLAVLWTAARPLSPSQAALILEKSRGSIKKLLAAMYHDGHVTRVNGRYVPNVPTLNAAIRPVRVPASVSVTAAPPGR